ncbi:MAG: divergent polysaccharide deacetylase family protein [Desulfarculus sp.]|nr:divergent polysaccharide deacetylase family protein [Pseudomonadota bacterium]MBV1718227.1 divergent polysaccharide deacetylase family protein [Desulfarculus sp.]MBU4576628.1 divergent polysaccharide deacetylase family protein [Pseudomonadota bacterium]MBU4597786.1 divergent polysaccharide deacetylase family protein [Pseudomonadota bacterium]MBV1737999.1 divergent polysaccharide deacetylase family protein [Desulfarculus sp.]
MTQRKKSKKRTPRRRRALWALAVAGVVFAFLTGLWWSTPAPRRPAPKQPAQKAAQAPVPKAKPAVEPKKASPPAESAAKPPTAPRPMVAIIIDDMGHGLGPAQRLAGLGMPLTFSILPHSLQAKAVARLAHAHGVEVMLHLPMEPKGYPSRNPGQGVLLREMTRERLLEVLRDDLARVPSAAGVNNHMGSAFTLHPELLEPVLLEIKRRGLFYLDSFTSADSLGLATAQRLGLCTGRRDVFLDHQTNREAIDQQMRRLLALAKERGRAVAIGHPHPETIKALEEWAPRLRRQVVLVKVSEALSARSSPGKGH